ncbi:MAG: type II toxin-antitoxin system death-on-curing family toxin [Desulfamplus sp.]|nr:type II toxin-antitoxin system death-on-curing family toxin [Desulfamplus sp.]
MLFLYKTEVINIQKRLIKEFGGINGLRDEGALESALASAENRAYYENADIATCAATYAYHITQAHAFFDGNKRIAAAVSEIFAEINGLKLNATNDQIVDLFLSIASGEKSRDDVEHIFLQWIS